MQNISFDDGYKSYMINNDENKVIRVNISDLNIKKRYDDTTEKLFAEIDKAKAEVATPEVMAEVDRAIRDHLNYIFGSDICTAAFGTANVLSPVSSGKTLIESFLDAFLPTITADIERAANAAKISLEAKTDKYIKPVLAKPPVVGMTAKPVDISKLTDEQKNALLAELIK